MMLPVHFRPFSVACVAAALLAGCFGPATAPVPPPVPEPTPAPAMPAPTATPVATPAPAPISGWQISGILLRDAQVVPGAVVRAYDLASGDPLPWQGGTGEVKTDATGRFSGRLAAQTAVQVVRLVAEADEQAWVAVFDTQGKGVGLGAARALQQTERILPLSLRLTGASTFGAKAFEGLFKLVFRLSDARIPGLLQEAFAAAESARQEAEQRFADQPQLETKLLQGIDAQGQWREATTFETLSKELGLGSTAKNRLRTMLATVAAEAQAFEVKAGLEPIAPTDFWLEGIQIGADGTMTFTDAQGRTQRVVLGPNRSLAPSPSPSPTPRSSGGGGSGGGGGSRFVPPPPPPSPQFKLLAGVPGSLPVDGDALSSAVLEFPRALAVSQDGDVYFTQFSSGVRAVRRYRPIFGTVDRVVGSYESSGIDTLNNWLTLRALEAASADSLYLADGSELKRVLIASPTSSVESVKAASDVIYALAKGKDGTLWVALETQLYQFDPVSGDLTWMAGTGARGSSDGNGQASATFQHIRDIVFEPDTGRVYLLDDGHLLRCYDPVASTVTTLAGAPEVSVAQDGEGSAARFEDAWGLAVESSGSLLVGDVPDLRRVSVASGTVSTWSRVGLSFSAPEYPGEGDIEIDGSGRIFVADFSGNRLIEVLR